jgi:cation transport ATPase
MFMAHEIRNFQITGMTCQACASRVEGSVSSLKGVKKASVDFFQNNLKVEFNHIDLKLKQIISAVTKLGYQAAEQSHTEKNELKGNIAVSKTELNHQLVFLPIIFGFIGIITISGLYILILSVLNNLDYAWSQFLFLANWMVPLVIGFGIQVGMFSYMRRFARLAKSGKLSGAPVVASAGISTGSMIACCLHHVVDFLPFLGLSAVAIFASQFQSFLLAVGIVSNLIGITFIFYTIQKHHLFLSEGNLAKMKGLNMKAALYLTIIIGLAWLTYLFYLQY